MSRFDVLVVGSGLAGLTAALHLAENRRVGLLTKQRLTDGASGWAQGGIAAVLSDVDSTDDHVRDTMIAGAGLCDPEITRLVVEHAHEAIDWLVELGVPFTRDAQSDSGFHLTREGGHRFRRIIHAADATGRAVQETLLQKVIEHPNIVALEHHVAIDLIMGAKLDRNDRHCHGLYALDQSSGRIETYAAGHVILATGGAGKAYLYTTNPDIATGDGIAMGWRAGCRVQNMEFIQFHPTCLYHPQAKSFLISEAVRGEGGLLRLPNAQGQPDTAGERFMPAHDARAELAPRDIVARAIDYEMKKRGLDCVYLDITHKSEAFLREHFPTIFERCLELGIDISKQPIPVVPAAHYTCGGLKVDRAARTDVQNLYAVGETACTGLHGANRLASNSLLECLVFARAAAADIQASTPAPPRELPHWDESRVTDADEEVVIAHNWDELRRFMWDYVGIVRTNKRLERAANRIKLLQQEIHEYYSNFRVTNDLIELRNLVQTADLIVRCARLRHESRGLHYSLDYPEIADVAASTVLTPANFIAR